MARAPHLRRGVAGGVQHPGRVHDERERVIDVFGKPVPRLYAADEPGGVFGHLYLSGGNLAACFVGGHVAADETRTDGAT